MCILFLFVVALFQDKRRNTAMAAGFTPVNKRMLENTFMYVYHIRDGYQSTSMSFKIKIDKFSKMKENEVYKIQLSYKNWILYVLKKKNAVTLTLRTFSGVTYNVQCKVMYGNNSTSHSICANKVSDDEYVIKLSSDVIYSKLNEFRKEDCMFCGFHVECGIDARILRPVTESTIERKHESVLCINQLQEETAEMALVRNLSDVEYTKFTDFRIRAGNTIVGVSKGILAARSKFFFDYLKDNPDAEGIELNTSFGALKLAMEYIYCGNCQVGDISTMLTLMKLAKMLQMKRLYEMCYNYVKNSIDASNAQLIREMGSYIGEDELVSSADQFFTRK